MIEVTVKLKGRRHRGELAHIRIENLTTGSADHADYSVQFAVQAGHGPALYQRSIYQFPRKHLNVLALLRLALETLEEKELTLDTDPDASGPSDLAGRLLGPL